MVDVLNGSASCPWDLYSCDVDRSGTVNATDILGVIDLLNGARAFTAWNNRALPTRPAACPVSYPPGGGSSASASLGPDDDQGLANARLADAIVRYYTTVDLAAEATPDTAMALIRALRDWCVDHFSASERGALAERLSDPTLSYPDPDVAVMIPRIVESLRK